MVQGLDNVAQICENGHVIIVSLKRQSWAARKYCESCGAPTLSACRRCNHPIWGCYPDYEDEGYAYQYEPPSFCGECGSPFPWTETAIREWQALSEMMKGLNKQERQRLSSVIDDLARDTPGTQRALLTLKLLIQKLSKEGWAMMREVLVRVASEGVKGQLPP